MSDNTISNNNNKVYQNSQVTERLSPTNIISNNLRIDNNTQSTLPQIQTNLYPPNNNTIPLQPLYPTNTPILHQLNVPHLSLSVPPPPPAAFQIQPVQAPKLNPSAPTFTPNPFAVQPSIQIDALKQSIQESFGKMQILSLQLNALQLLNQQNQTIQSLQQYQSVYNQYQLEFANNLLLTQCLNNITNLTLNTPISPPNDAQISDDKKVGITHLETIEEGEDEEEEMENDETIAQIAGISTNFTSKNNDDEGTAGYISKDPDHALLTGTNGEQLPVHNFWKFPKNPTTKFGETTTENTEKFGEKPPNSELEKIKKQIRGILNKITPENFDKLSQEIASILKVVDLAVCSKNKPMSSEEIKVAQKAQFKVLIKLILKCILEKAINEPLFSNQYARLCYSLYLYAEDNEMKKKLFRQQLLRFESISQKV